MRSRITQVLALGLAIVALVALAAFPLGVLFVRSFSRDGQLSIDNYIQVFAEPLNYLPLWNTLQLGLWTVLLAAGIGVPLAWLVARTDLPGRRIIENLSLLPYMVPPFIGAIAWVQLLAPRVGYVNRLWTSLVGATNPLFNIYSFGGMVWVMGIYSFPFVFIAVRGALERMNPSLEEAARIAGARRLQVLRDVTIPLVVPSIASGMMLAFLYTVANFGIPALLGMRARIPVLTTRIYTYVHRGDFTGIQLAAALSVLLMGLAVVLLLTNQLLLRKQHGAAIISGKSVRPTLVELGPWKHVAAVGVYLFMGLAIIAPLVALVLTSFLKAWGLPLTWQNFTIRNYLYILFDYSLTKSAILNSLSLALITATLAVVLGSFLAYISAKTRLRGRKLVDILCTLPNAIPGTVVALAMILAWSGQFGINIYNTFAILVVAYVAHYTFYAFRNTSASLVQIHSSLEEAARVSGAGWFQNLRDVVVPLIRPGLVAGWLLVFMPALRELNISILLYGPRTPTIGVAVFELQDAGYYHIAAALGSVVVAVVFVINLIMRRIVGGRGTV